MPHPNRLLLLIAVGAAAAEEGLPLVVAVEPAVDEQRLEDEVAAPDRPGAPPGAVRGGRASTPSSASPPASSTDVAMPEPPASAQGGIRAPEPQSPFPPPGFAPPSAPPSPDPSPLMGSIRPTVDTRMGRLTPAR